MPLVLDAGLKRLLIDAADKRTDLLLVRIPEASRSTVFALVFPSRDFEAGVAIIFSVRVLLYSEKWRCLIIRREY